jgi:hypothetical protein
MIKSYEGQTVSNAMIDAIVAQEIQRQKTAREAELEAEVKSLQMELDLRKTRDTAIYTRFIDDADRDYAYVDEHSMISDIYWAVIGWIVLAFAALFDAVGV